MSAKRKQTVLVTGGSGFLGINLIRYLHEKRYNIIALDIAEFTYDDMKNKILFIKGDIRDKKTVDDAVKRSDIVVHCAAALPLYTPHDIYTTDVDGTRNVLESCRKNNIKRTIHISSTAVYGIPDHHPLHEHDRLHGVGPYGKAKILAENICLAYRRKGMCVPILRPKSFIGPERLGVMAIYYEWIRQGRNIPIIGKGNNRYQLLDVEDLCQAIYLCMTKPARQVNDTFNIGAEEFTTMREDFGAVLLYAGTKKKIRSLPAKPTKITLQLLETLKLSPLYKWVYDSATQDSFVSVEKAKEKLGFTPRYSNKQALIRNYIWYVEHHNEFKHSAGISHRRPWKQGILKIVAYFF